MTACALAVLVLSALLAWSQLRVRSTAAHVVFERYGELVTTGHVPYRDFRVEYPPGALPTFVVPSLIHERSSTPVWTPAMNEPARNWTMGFAIFMFALVGVLIALTAWSLHALGSTTTEAATALGVIALSPLLLGDLVFTRFDVLPAVLTAAALAALLYDRPRLAAVALGAGVTTKLYPMLLVPLAFVWIWRRSGRREAGAAALVGALTVAAVFVPFLVMAPGNTWWSVSEQLRRGLQGESLGASLMAGAHVLTYQLELRGIPIPVIPFDVDLTTAGVRSAVVDDGAFAELIAILTGLVPLVVLAWAAVSLARRSVVGPRLVVLSAAVVTAQVAFGRVLSPQFLVWLLPLVPLVRGRGGIAASAVFVGALVTTHVWYPEWYGRYLRGVFSGESAPTAILLGRNALLVALLIILIWAAHRADRPVDCPDRVTARA
jgi:Glycosyltransferase family 87